MERLTTLVGVGRGDGAESLSVAVRRVAGERLGGGRRRHAADAVGRQRPHVPVIAHDRDADRSRRDGPRRAGAPRAVGGGGGGGALAGAARAAPRVGAAAAAAADHVVVGSGGRRRRARPLQPLRQTVAPR